MFFLNKYIIWFECLLCFYVVIYVTARIYTGDASVQLYNFTDPVFCTAQVLELSIISVSSSPAVETHQVHELHLVVILSVCCFPGRFLFSFLLKSLEIAGRAAPVIWLSSSWLHLRHSITEKRC